MAIYLRSTFANRPFVSSNVRHFCLSARRASKKDDVFNEDDEKVKATKNLLEKLDDREKYWEYHQKGYGHVYDKKPFKVLCKEGKVYLWCACGHSKQQPFCDGTHRIQHYKINFSPVPFTCKETKEYWFCNCKHTRHRPFCDGTHRSEEVEKLPSTIKY